MHPTRQPRVILDEPVSLLMPAGPEFTGRIRNLSRGGAFIVDLPAHPPVSSRVHLCFALPDGPSVDTEATVLRAVTDETAPEPEGIAVRFEELDPANLDAFIRQAEEPASGEQDRVRLKLDTQDVVISARAHSKKRGAMVLECDLPFLCIGTGVQLQQGEDPELRSGTLAWVSTQVPPGSPYPRIHLGIALEPGREDPTPDLLPPSRRRITARQDPTEIVRLAPPQQKSTSARRTTSWLAPLSAAILLSGLLVASALIYAGRRGPAPEPSPSPPGLVIPTTATTPVVPAAPDPAADPEPAPPPEAVTVRVKRALARGAVRRRRRPRRTVKRVQKLVTARQHLAQARRDFQGRRYEDARRRALRVLALQPGNQQAAELIRRLNRRLRRAD